MTIVGPRLNPQLVKIDGLPCRKGYARRATTCHHSRKPIEPGAAVYRPLGNSNSRGFRWLASEIEALEASDNRGEP